MIDLHCHILPEADDGSATEEESRMMAKIAVENGVNSIVMTPHCNVPGQFDNYADQQLAERFKSFTELLKKNDIPLNVYTGMEVYVTDDLPELIRQRKLITLNRTRYLLMEFGFDEPADYMERMLLTVKGIGLMPIIAHPERYYCVQDDNNILMRWANEGFVLQLNKGSLFGMFGRHAMNTAHWCLNEGCVHVIGSDAHSPYRRTPRLSDAWEYVADYNNPDIADLLLETNPMSILNNNSVRSVMEVFKF